jgi:hypothetical protein
MAKRHHSILFTIVAALLAHAACTPSATPQGTDEPTAKATAQGVEFKLYPRYVGEFGKWMVSVQGHETLPWNERNELRPLLIVEYLGNPGVPPLAARMNAISTVIDEDFQGNEYSWFDPDTAVRLGREGMWRFSIIVDGKEFAIEIEITEPSADMPGFPVTVGANDRVLGMLCYPDSEDPCHYPPAGYF